MNHLHQWERGQDRHTATEELAHLQEALDRLPKEDRDLVRLCFIEGLSYDEASAALGLTPPARRKRVQRIRGRLRSFRTATTGTQYEN